MKIQRASLPMTRVLLDAFLAASLLVIPIVSAQTVANEQQIRQAITLFDKVPDVKLNADAPLFSIAQGQTRKFLTTLVGSNEEAFVERFFISDIQSINKQGSVIEIRYAKELNLSNDQVPSKWRAQLNKTLSEGGSSGAFESLTRQKVIRLTVNSKESTLAAEGVALNLSNAFLFFGATLESPTAKLVNREGVLGLEVGLLPKVAGGIFSGDRRVLFIPLSSLGNAITVKTLNYIQNSGQPFAASPEVNSTPVTASELYVDATKGNDANPGTVDQPFRTLTTAVNKASSNVSIKIATGSYTVASGEVFPIQPKSGTVLTGVGNVVIQGGEKFASRTFGRQSVVLVAPKEGVIENITITNTADLQRGFGVWVESANATIKNCRLINNALDGLFITGTSKAQIISNTISGNKANGVTTAKTAQPLLQGNILTDNGTGLTVADQSRPFLDNNQVTRNRYGVVVESEGFPRLRGNTISQNRDHGLVGVGGGKADIGGPQDNQITGNRIDVKLQPPKGGSGFSQ